MKEDLPLPDCPTTITNGYSRTLRTSCPMGLSGSSALPRPNKEECGILFPERVKAPIRANGLSRHVRRSLTALDGRQQVLKLVRCIGHFRDMREFDPGEDPKKIEG